MKKEFRKQFISNLKEIKNKDIADDVEHILELVETANNTGLLGLASFSNEVICRLRR